MKIQKLSIHNFKGIDLLEFEPKRINVIVGRNNTCKTTLLEAIHLSFYKKINRRKHLNSLINVRSEESKIESVVDGKTSVMEIKKPSIQNIIIKFKKDILKNLRGYLERFKQKKLNEEMEKDLNRLLETYIDQEIGAEILTESVAVTVDGKEEIYIAHHSEKISKRHEIISELIAKQLRKNFELRIDRELLFYMINQSYRPSFRPINEKSEPQQVIFIQELVPKVPDEISKEDSVKLHDVDALIKKYHLVKGLEKFDFDFLLFKEGSKVYPIPYTFMGDGFKAMVGLLWHFSSRDIQNKIVLIEEPETHMHPGYITELTRLLIKFSKEMDIQFFITSHSIDFVNSFFEEGIVAEYEDYLAKEFFLLRMETTEKGTLIPYYLGYADAKTDKDVSLLDLRGI